MEATHAGPIVGCGSLGYPGIHNFSFKTRVLNNRFNGSYRSPYVNNRYIEQNMSTDELK